MKTKSLLLSVAAAGLLALFAADASAAIVYEYRAGQDTYGNAPGDPVSVDLFFRETRTAGEPSLLAAEDGLSDLTVRVTRSGGNATIASATANAAFADGSTSATVTGGGTVATLNLHVPLAGSGAGVEPVSPLGVYLGTVNLTNGTAASAFSFDTTGAGTITYASIYDLEASPQSNGLAAGAYVPAEGTTFTVLVPEPAALAAFAGLGVAALRRRRGA